MLNKTIEDSRMYGGLDANGRHWKPFEVKYSIRINAQGRIEDIRNQNGYLIEKSSECFDYFRSKYE